MLCRYRHCLVLSLRPLREHSRHNRQHLTAAAAQVILLGQAVVVPAAAYQQVGSKSPQMSHNWRLGWWQWCLRMCKAGCMCSGSGSRSIGITRTDLQVTFVGIGIEAALLCQS